MVRAACGGRVCFGFGPGCPAGCGLGTQPAGTCSHQSVGYGHKSNSGDVLHHDRIVLVFLRPGSGVYLLSHVLSHCLDPHGGGHPQCGRAAAGDVPGFPRPP
ncbi:hypothetical protein D3C76_1628680 [compost metagenome]